MEEPNDPVPTLPDPTHLQRIVLQKFADAEDLDIAIPFSPEEAAAAGALEERACPRQSPSMKAGKSIGGSDRYITGVVSELVKRLKAGTARWRRPWSDGPALASYNPTTGALFHGINAIAMQLAGREDPCWMT